MYAFVMPFSEWANASKISPMISKPTDSLAIYVGRDHIYAPLKMLEQLAGASELSSRSLLNGV